MWDESVLGGCRFESNIISGAVVACELAITRHEHILAAIPYIQELARVACSFVGKKLDTNPPL